MSEKDRLRALLATMIYLRCQFEDCIDELDLLLGSEGPRDPPDPQIGFIKRNSYLVGERNSYLIGE